MLTQHYHIIDSEEYPDIREVEVYVNGAYLIEIKDVAPDDEYPQRDCPDARNGERPCRCTNPNAEMICRITLDIFP